MAISFSKLKDPKLQLTDKLTFGKFKDCRICDIIPDHYEYLIWAESNGYVKLQQEVKDLIAETANSSNWEDPSEKVNEMPGFNPWGSDAWDDDIPF